MYIYNISDISIIVNIIVNLLKKKKNFFLQHKNSDSLFYLSFTQNR